MAKASASGTMIFAFPLKGIVDVLAYNKQPPTTCIDALNVRPFDPRSGRARGGKRAGTSKLYATAVGATGLVQGLFQDTLRGPPLPPTPAVPPVGPSVGALIGGENGWAAFVADGPPDYLNGDPIDDGDGLWETYVYELFDPAWRTPNLIINGAGRAGLGSEYAAFDRTVMGSTGYETAAVLFTNPAFVAVAPVDNWRCAMSIHLYKKLIGTSMSWTLATNCYDPREPAVSMWQGIVVLYTNGVITLYVAGNPVGTVNIGNTFVATPVPPASIAAYSPYSPGFNSDLFITVRRLGNAITVTLHDDLNVQPDAIITYDDTSNGYLATMESQVTIDDLIANGYAVPENKWYGFTVNGSIAEDFEMDVTQFYISAMNPGSPGSDASSGTGGDIRNVVLVAVVDGSIYWGDLMSDALTLFTGGAGVLDDFIIPGAGFTQGKGYFVDGTSIIQVDMSSLAVEAYAATAGAAPTGCTLACIWRNRLVLAADPPDSYHLWFMSRVGVATDWDYTQQDAAAAVAGNNSLAGQIGQPITALIPFDDDNLIFGADSSIYRMSGDPAAGGVIDLVSDRIGVLGARAWTKDEGGVIYFVGTGGFYRMIPGGKPECLSIGTLNTFFTGINRETHYVLCTWDADRHGCHIFITPPSSAAAIHVWYDGRTGGFFKEQYPDRFGPISALVYDGSAALDRTMLIGGRTGFIYREQDDVVNDDDDAIDSYIIFGPQMPLGPDHNVRLIDSQFFLGNERAGFDYSLSARTIAGDDPYEVLELVGDIDSYDVTFTTRGRQDRQRSRLRGSCYTMKVSDATVGSTWSFEQALLTWQDAGPVR